MRPWRSWSICEKRQVRILPSEVSRTRLQAPEPYALTAELLAWGAGRAAEHGVAGVGALDAVAAFGLDEVEKGAAEAGIVVEG